jgi:hypothetical protein
VWWVHGHRAFGQAFLQSAVNTDSYDVARKYCLTARYLYAKGEGIPKATDHWVIYDHSKRDANWRDWSRPVSGGIGTSKPHSLGWRALMSARSEGRFLNERPNTALSKTRICPSRRSKRQSPMAISEVLRRIGSTFRSAASVKS